MRRSYLLEYTILLVVCFFSVRACMSERQANTTLKTENTAISDSTDMYKEKYGQEHAANQALLDTTQQKAKHTPDSLSHIFNAFRRQIQDASAVINTVMFVEADSSYAGNKEVIRFQYGNKWITASGMLVITHTQYGAEDCHEPVAGNMLKLLSPACSSCHANTGSGNMYTYIR